MTRTEYNKEVRRIKKEIEQAHTTIYNLNCLLSRLSMDHFGMTNSVSCPDDDDEYV